LDAVAMSADPTFPEWNGFYYLGGIFENRRFNPTPAPAHWIRAPASDFVGSFLV
jgi:hypothetical protein